MASNAHGFLNSVFVDGDIMLGILTNSGSADFPDLPTSLSPTTFDVCNHNSATFARNLITAPAAAASKKQTLAGLVLPTDFDWVSSSPDSIYYWDWNMTEYEFAPFAGTAYSLQAVSLNGYDSTPDFTGWGAFGPVESPTTINVNDIVVYLIGNLRIGYKNEGT